MSRIRCVSEIHPVDPNIEFCPNTPSPSYVGYPMIHGTWYSRQLVPVPRSFVPFAPARNAHFFMLIFINLSFFSILSYIIIYVYYYIHAPTSTWCRTQINHFPPNYSILFVLFRNCLLVLFFSCVFILILYIYFLCIHPYTFIYSLPYLHFFLFLFL